MLAWTAAPPEATAKSTLATQGRKKAPKKTPPKKPKRARGTTPEVVPPVVALMFSIGEKTGSIGEVLEKIGNYYDDQVAATTEVLVSLMEPLMIVVMGVTVTIIAVSMFLPIFNMTKMIH